MRQAPSGGARHAGGVRADAERAPGNDPGNDPKNDTGNGAGAERGSRDVGDVGTDDDLDLHTSDAGRAFARWVEPELDVLLRVARSLTGSWADAEDVVQETLIRAYRGIDGFDGAHPRAWLLTIVRRTYLNSVRRRRPGLLDDAARLESKRPAFGRHDVPTPEDVVTDRHLDDALEEAIDGLDARFRTVLLLVDVDDLTYAEVGETLGIPVGTVMSRLSRARSRVRDRLAGSALDRRNR